MRHRHIMEMRSEMKYIESLREGERINEIYLCKVKQSALTKAGKPYDNLILQDKTGTLDAKIWEPGSVGIDEFDSLDYIAVMGDITSFQGNLQLNVKRVRKVQERLSAGIQKGHRRDVYRASRTDCFREAPIFKKASGELFCRG